MYLDNLFNSTWLISCVFREVVIQITWVSISGYVFLIEEMLSGRRDICNVDSHYVGL